MSNLGLLGLGMLLCGSCAGSKQGSTSQATLGIFGQVHTEDGTALTTATVCMAAGEPCFNVDANGNYKIPYEGTTVSTSVLNFSAPGYARRSMRLRGSNEVQAIVTLRKIDLTSTVTLPTGTMPAVSVEVLKADATTTLSIPPDSLVDTSGRAASGDANVSMTFWHPLQPRFSAPGNLITQDANGFKPLTTFGMADIEVEQGGALLQVASGKNLVWSIHEPDIVAATMSPNMLIPMKIPNSYSLDRQTGLWHLEGSPATGAVHWDANTQIITAQLPHLTGWNIDEDAGPQYGGCVTGRVIDPCGNPVANRGLTFWSMGFEELKDWTGQQTDASGNYCIDVYLSSYNVTSGNRDVTYFISGADNASDTTMCNPVPPSCLNCVDEGAGSFSSVGWCSNCALLDKNGVAVLFGGYDSLVVYQNTCDAPTVTLVPYTSCAASNCTVLADVTLTSPTCSKAPPAPPGGSGGACAINGGGKAEGQYCTAYDVCCPLGALECADNLCVPVNDPPVLTQ